MAHALRRSAFAAVLCGASLASAASWQTLARGEIKPRGWMLRQMQRDITSGVLSAYPELRGLGAPIGDNPTRSYYESEGNYFDALVRNAYLAGDAAAIAKAGRIMQGALSTRLPNGYFGRGAVRAPVDILKSNVELWSQCCFLRGALAYAEYSANPAVLAAVRKDVDLFIALFDQGRIDYFQRADNELLIAGSRTHGLMYVDVLEQLYRLTGDEHYARFARRLYEDYSASAVRNADNKLPNLLARDRMFLEHAPHTAEHFRVPLFLADATGDSRYREAVDNIVYKLNKSQSPSRMLVADPWRWESVAGNYGSDTLPYEYCTIREMVASLASGYQKTGRGGFADDVESVMFNTAQAARFSDGKAVAYYSHDSQCELSYDPSLPGTFRYQYGARHQIGCCTINAFRVLPEYIEHMWLKSADGRTLLAALHGASTVTTVLSGRRVTVTASTDYPFGSRITYEVAPATALAFTLAVRVPRWAAGTRIDAPGATIVREGDHVAITKEWRPGETVAVEFDAPICVTRFMDNKLFVTKGPLVYALPIPARKIATAEFLHGAFANYNVTAADSNERAKFEGYGMPAGADLPGAAPWGKYVARSGSVEYPYDNPPGVIEGMCIDGGKRIRATLVPMGAVLLRKVLFPQAR